MLFGKEKGFEKIVLSDQAKYDCKDNNYGIRYEIKYLHTLTHGSTWYSKYGFKFINKLDEEALSYNKLILDKLKTKDYPFELLIRIIMYEVVDQKICDFMSKYNYLLNINKIIKLYDEYKERPFYRFIKVISRECCMITSLIYMKIFESLKLKKYLSSEMELIIL